MQDAHFDGFAVRLRMASESNLVLAKHKAEGWAVRFLRPRYVLPCVRARLSGILESPVRQDTEAFALHAGDGTW